MHDRGKCHIREDMEEAWQLGSVLRIAYIVNVEYLSGPSFSCFQLSFKGWNRAFQVREIGAVDQYVESAPLAQPTMNRAQAEQQLLPGEKVKDIGGEHGIDRLRG